MSKRVLSVMAVVMLALALAAPALAVPMLTADDNMTSDRTLNYDDGGTPGTIVGVFDGVDTTTWSWTGLSGLDMNGKQLTYKENLGTYSYGYNLVFDLWNGTSNTSLTGGGVITTSLGTRTDRGNGDITIRNAADIAVGTLTTYNYDYAGAPGTITVSQSGSFSATTTNTTSGGSDGGSAQTFTGGDGGAFTVTAGILSHAGGNGSGGDVSIQDYTSVSIAGGIKTYATQRASWIRGGNVTIGDVSNPISGPITISGGLDTRGAGSPSGIVKLYAEGPISVSGPIVLVGYNDSTYHNKRYMELHTTGASSDITLGDPGNPTGETLDLGLMQYALFDSGSGVSYIYADIEGFTGEASPNSQLRVSNAGDIIYYSREANPDLLADAFPGGENGWYDLLGGGFLAPEPLPVPEPAGLGLLGLALLGLRKRRS